MQFVKNVARTLEFNLYLFLLEDCKDNRLREKSANNQPVQQQPIHPQEEKLPAKSASRSGMQP